LTGGRYAAEIIANLQWREIGMVPVGPRLVAPAATASHAFSTRTVLPGGQADLPRMSYRERWQVARRSYMVPPP
jgi:hypothetical protein